METKVKTAAKEETNHKNNMCIKVEEMTCRTGQVRKGRTRFKQKIRAKKTESNQQEDRLKVMSSALPFFFFFFLNLRGPEMVSKGPPVKQRAKPLHDAEPGPEEAERVAVAE